MRPRPIFDFGFMPTIAGRPARLLDLEDSEIGIGVLPVVLRTHRSGPREEGECCKQADDCCATKQNRRSRMNNHWRRSAHHQHRDGNHRDADSNRQCDKRTARAEAGLDRGLAAGDLPEQYLQVAKRDRRREE